MFILMLKNIRFQEYSVFFYRIFLVFLFYSLARFLFIFFNNSIVEVNSFDAFISVSRYGLIFDTVAVFYVNSLFIVLSLIPLLVNTNEKYQKVLFYIYFVFNTIAYATNFIDFIYYQYTFERSTIGSLEVVQNESNKIAMFFRFFVTYWYVFLLFFALVFLWITLYNRVRVVKKTVANKLVYFVSSIIIFLGVILIVVAGVRGGDLKKTTRPITLVDANTYVKKMTHADVVLNTPFTIIRTINNNGFKKVKFNITKEEIASRIGGKRVYKKDSLFKEKTNIVLLIVESFSREYSAYFNKGIRKNYKGYTPFIDSLSKHSLIFTNAFANGRKSIHAMGAVLAGIPSFKQSFTTSKYVKQSIQSAVSIAKEKGYRTSFFHGAPNGSMGFLGFSNVLGFDKYYGLNEYGNDEDHDGSWGIWDEEFLQYMKTVLGQQKEPFFSTVFTLSSHEPFVLPKRYKGKFPIGNIQMHQSIGYTDFALKRFFNEAKKQAWFKNTVFIITGDHGNQIYESNYKKIMNRNVLPIIIYKPDNSFKGVNSELAQQMDIYPTIVNLIGYEKPFRSWGRSLLQKDNVNPYVVNGGGQIQFQQGDYICTFSKDKITGIYSIKDRDLANNLIKNKNPKMLDVQRNFEAFLKDYFDRIIDKKLN